MTEQTARLLLEAAQNLAQTNDKFNKVRIYENYSGRGMMGKTTTAIVYPDIATMNSCLIQAAYDVSDQDEEAHPTAKRDFMRDIETARHDMLGLDRLIY